MEFISLFIFMVLIYIAMTLRAMEKHNQAAAQMRAERELKLIKEVESLRNRIDRELNNRL